MVKKCNEQGRSMIEMLGVLAIVGVLSVAGIAGYHKAMGKYKTGQILDQFTNINHNLQEIFGKINTYKGFASNSNPMDLAIKLGVFPDRMVQVVDGTQVVRHAAGGAVTLSFNTGNVSVTFHDLNKETAMALATAELKANWIKIENSEN